MDKVREALKSVYDNWFNSVEKPKLGFVDSTIKELETAGYEIVLKDNWQDISTAPIDGEQFIVYLSNGWQIILSGNFDKNSRYAWWNCGRLSVPYVPSHPEDTNWEATLTLVATHWQSLPNPPKKGE